MNNGITVRDFIYVDADRLYSLYSQIFEGVADQIIESSIAELSSSKSQKSSLFGGSVTGAQAGEASHRIENKSLYDHMYNHLEKKLGGIITSASNISPDNYQQDLSEAFIIKASGTAEIEDYERIDTFMERFNELADAIGFSQLHDLRESVEAGWKENEEQIRQITDRNKKSNAKKKLEKEKRDFKQRVEEYLVNTGLRQDEQLLTNLRLFIEIFNPHGFEITITPHDSSGKVVYRGVLDRKWLRVQPDFLRALYGQEVKSVWTMVGKITYIPGGSIVDEVHVTPSEKGTSDQNDILSEIEDSEPSMRDPFRGMFSSARAFDQMFLESKERAEILIAPMAIYHEVVIPDIEVTNEED